MSDLFQIRRTASELTHILGLTIGALVYKEAAAAHQEEKARLQSIVEETGAQTERDLIRILNSRRASQNLRARICTSLGDLRSLTAIPSLLRILASDKSDVGWAAQHALVHIQSRRATPGLMSIVRHGKFGQNRVLATYVLRWQDDPRADKLMLKLLRDHRRAGSMRAFAAEALTWESRQIEIINALLDVTRDKSAFMRYTAIHCLDHFWERYPAIEESLNDRVLARLRECCADKDGIPGYEQNNGQRARLVLKYYREFSKSKRRSARPLSDLA